MEPSATGGITARRADTRVESRAMRSSAKKSKTQSSTTAPNAFAGSRTAPTECELAAALGPSKKLWDPLIKNLARDLGLRAEWGSSSVKAGWSLRLKLKDRVAVYVIPNPNSFQAALVLGDKAVKAAKQSALPANVQKIIGESRRYAEGTGIRIAVQGDREIAAIMQLARIKLEN